MDEAPIRSADALCANLRQLAGQVEGLLGALSPGSPLLLAGGWGTGKSSLLHAIADLHRANGGSVIWFEAWRNEGEGPLIASLVLQIARAALDRSPGNRFAMVSSEAIAAARSLDMPATNDLRAPDGPEHLSQALHALFELAWPDRPPLILLDDLDRCSPDGAVHLLDQLRALLVRLPGATARPLPARFLVALDRAVMAKAISRKFAGIEGFEGNRYLDKIFPLSLQLPRPEAADLARLVEGWLDTLGFSRDNPHWDPARRALVQDGQGLFANPRLLKVCLNRFRLLIHFEDQSTATESRPDPAADRTVVLYLAAIERWPALRPLLQSQDDDWWNRLRDPTTKGGEAPTAEGRSLLAEPGVATWLRHNFYAGPANQLATFRAADTRLRRFGL